MADYKKLKELFGNVEDNKDDIFQGQYNTYDKLVNDALYKARANLGEKQRNIIQTYSLDGYTPKPRQINRSDSNPILDIVEKQNPKLSRELEDVRLGSDPDVHLDRSHINNQIIKGVLNKINPTIVNNEKYLYQNAKDREEIYKLSTDLHNQNFNTFFPLIKELMEKEYGVTNNPEFAGAIDRDYDGRYNPYTAGRNHQRTNKIEINPLYTSFETIPHEILHSFTPTEGNTERVLNRNIYNDKLRTFLANDQSEHIIDTKSEKEDRDREEESRSSFKTYDNSEIEQAPQGESSLYWRLIKHLIEKGNKE